MPLYHDHLTIEGIKFSWTDGKLISGHLDGAKRLSELTGHNFTEFLTKLEGEDDGGRPRNQLRDHLPIELSFRGDSPVVVVGEGDSELPLLPKLKWTDSDNNYFKEKVNQLIATVLVYANIQENVDSVVNCITNSAHSQLRPGGNLSHLKRKSRHGLILRV
ncbi:hypothetical protein J6590_040797 [Homalodisca vitripennis]|nr:hypothetical protein J6590_040797 [Homalodisca vitripennis]